MLLKWPVMSFADLWCQVSLGGVKIKQKEMNKMIKIFFLHQYEQNIYIDLSTQVCQISSIRGPASVIKQKKTNEITLRPTIITP